MFRERVSCIKEDLGRGRKAGGTGGDEKLDLNSDPGEDCRNSSGSGKLTAFWKEAKNRRREGTRKKQRIGKRKKEVDLFRKKNT